MCTLTPKKIVEAAKNPLDPSKNLDALALKTGRDDAKSTRDFLTNKKKDDPSIRTLIDQKNAETAKMEEDNRQTRARLEAQKSGRKTMIGSY